MEKKSVSSHVLEQYPDAKPVKKRKHIEIWAENGSKYLGKGKTIDVHGKAHTQTQSKYKFDMKTKLCRPVLVNCNETPVVGDIVANTEGEIDFLTENDGKEYAKTTKKQQLILISLDPNEKITTGDTYLTPTNNLTLAGESSHFDKEYKKVIAIQDQLSPEYISQFLENYNDYDNDVMIEMTAKDCLSSHEGNTVWIPRLTGRFVTIVEKEKKPITYTEEEVWELVWGVRSVFYYNNVPYNRLKPYVSDWFNQNKKR